MTRFLLALCVLALFLCPAAWPSDPAPSPAVPAATAADWHHDAPAAFEATTKQAASTAATAPAPSSFWGEVSSWAAGGALLLIGLGKLGGAANPLAGVIASVAGSVYDLVVAKHVRDAEAKRDLLASGLGKVVGVIEALPNTGTIGELKGKFLTKLPSAIVDHLTEVSAELQAQGVSPMQALAWIDQPAQPVAAST